MTKLVLSEKELAKLFSMMMLSAIFFGVSGLIGMLVMQWVTRQRYAQDSVDKHGISEIPASRLGGVVIICLSLALFLVHYIQGYNFSPVGPLGVHDWGWVAFALCATLGLIEDLNNDMLSPLWRLILLAIIFGGVFLIWPNAIPTEIGYQPLDNIMSQPILGWLLSVIFCIGFINAINMADGANGLVPGIIFLSSVIFHAVIGTLIWEVLLIISGVFLLFNVISGRLFLGDAGSYGLGAVLVLGGFYAVNTKWISVEFAAVMMCYPCLEVLVSMARRVVARHSPFKPDNNHLHNMLHNRLRAKTKSRVVANSATGLIIAGASTGVALVGSHSGWLSPVDSAWGWVFVGQIALYMICYTWLSYSARSESLKTA